MRNEIQNKMCDKRNIKLTHPFLERRSVAAANKVVIPGTFVFSESLRDSAAQTAVLYWPGVILYNTAAMQCTVQRCTVTDATREKRRDNHFEKKPFHIPTRPVTNRISHEAPTNRNVSYFNYHSVHEFIKNEKKSNNC